MCYCGTQLVSAGKMKNKTNIIELFEDAKADHNYLKVCAPMVRYSKVQFRTLVKK